MLDKQYGHRLEIVRSKREPGPAEAERALPELLRAVHTVAQPKKQGASTEAVVFFYTALPHQGNHWAQPSWGGAGLSGGPMMLPLGLPFIGALQGFLEHGRVAGNSGICAA